MNGALAEVLGAAARAADGGGGASAAMMATALANGRAADNKPATNTPLNRLMRASDAARVVTRPAQVAEHIPLKLR